MNRLTNLTPAEKKFLDDAIAAAERASGKKLNQGSSPSLPGHVRARRAADCAFWRFSGADTPKLPAIHSCE